MIEFNSPHYNKELEDYINSHPMFCEKNTLDGVICKEDFFHFIYKNNFLADEFKDIDYSFWIASSLIFVGYNGKPTEITWERVNEFFDFMETKWVEFYGGPSGFVKVIPGNEVVLTDDEDFVV